MGRLLESGKGSQGGMTHGPGKGGGISVCSTQSGTTFHLPDEKWVRGTPRYHRGLAIPHGGS